MSDHAQGELSEAENKVLFDWWMAYDEGEANFQDLAPAVDRILAARADAATAAVERVRALADEWWRWSQMGERVINHSGIAQDIVRDLRAALDAAPSTPTEGRDGGGEA